MTRIITIASAKGGVGKTVSAINLSAALAKNGMNVILVDGNLTAPHVGLSLGKASQDVDVHDVLSNRNNVEEAIYKHPSGIKVIPGNLSFKEILNIDTDKFTKMIKDLENKADFIIIDSAAGLHDTTIAAIKSASSVVVVTIPEMQSLTDALRTIKIAEHHNINVEGIILNRVRNDSTELDNKTVEDLTESTIIAIIPEDNAVRESIKLKSPVIHTHPHCGASAGFQMLAARLLGTKHQILNKPHVKNQALIKSLRQRFGF